ncbi:MAG TPA: TIGR02266 family protein, partial [Kofleriaceae bacterium]
MVDPNTRQGKRTPVTLKIKFKSETLEQFIERYAVDVSQGGIFIRTKEPLAVGTQMKFEFQLRDASPLIAGEGTVVWTRENDPSRPAIAPGMGVRFDRLADGSQGILERILTEKLKQAPQRPASDTSRPPMFTDTPTRVAPVPVQEALLGKDNGKSRRGDDHNDSHTPLPKPMPFHSDADEFPDEAFEEATKVRALDELIAQTAEGTPEELTARGGRPNGRSDATVTDPVSDRAAAAEAAHLPDLPNPPDVPRPHARTDSSPPPRSEPPP